MVAVTLLVGWTSLETLRAGGLSVGNASPLVAYLLLLAVIHAAFVVAGREMDEILLPAVAMLGGISVLLMERLPQDLVEQRIAGSLLDLGQLQLLWMSVASLWALA